MENKEREKGDPITRITEHLKTGHPISGIEIRDIFEASGYSRQSTSDLIGKFKTGAFQKETGMLIDIKREGNTKIYKNLFSPPYGSNIRPFRRRIR